MEFSAASIGATAEDFALAAVLTLLQQHKTAVRV
jgi:hypothetical protein